MGDNLKPLYFDDIILYPIRMSLDIQEIYNTLNDTTVKITLLQHKVDELKEQYKVLSEKVYIGDENDSIITQVSTNQSKLESLSSDVELLREQTRRDREKVTSWLWGVIMVFVTTIVTLGANTLLNNQRKETPLDGEASSLAMIDNLAVDYDR